MATGWIPVGVSTPRCTEVVRIASKSRKTRREAFAALVEFWIWVSQESDSGFLEGYQLETLAHVIEGTGAPFWDAVAAEGWIVVTADGLHVPDNKEHQFISKGGRARLMKGRRQGKWKEKKSKKEALKETFDEALAETRDETVFDVKASPPARPTTTTTVTVGNKPTKLTTSVGEDGELVVGLNAEDSERTWSEADRLAKRLGVAEPDDFLNRIAALLVFGRVRWQSVEDCAAEAKRSATENPIGLFRTKLRSAVKRCDSMAKAVQFTDDYLRGPPAQNEPHETVLSLVNAIARKDSP